MQGIKLHISVYIDIERTQMPSTRIHAHFSSLSMSSLIMIQSNYYVSISEHLLYTIHFSLECLKFTFQLLKFGINLKTTQI